jgi:hypothetical protein
LQDCLLHNGFAADLIRLACSINQRSYDARADTIESNITADASVVMMLWAAAQTHRSKGRHTNLFHKVHTFTCGFT